MHLHCTVYTAPKKNEINETNMDYASANLQAGFAAISDGATGAMCSGQWSQHLVEAYLDEPPAFDYAALNQWLDKLRPSYTRWLEDWAQKQSFFHRHLTERSGSQAAFMGLHLKSLPVEGKGQWQAFSIGDCNLTQIRDGKCILNWPWKSVLDFGRTPALICNYAWLGPEEDWYDPTVGDYEPGDIILLATDALAAWVLAQQEQRDFDIVKMLEDISNDWDGWLASVRKPNGNLHDDDTTLLVLRWRDITADKPCRIEAKDVLLASAPITTTQGNTADRTAFSREPLPDQKPSASEAEVPHEDAVPTSDQSSQPETSVIQDHIVLEYDFLLKQLNELVLRVDEIQAKMSSLGTLERDLKQIAADQDTLIHRLDALEAIVKSRQERLPFPYNLFTATFWKSLFAAGSR